MTDIEAIPFYWINRLGFLTRRELPQKLQAVGHEISHEEWVYLLILWAKGTQTPNDLAALTFRDRTTITRIVDGMAAKGLVVRQPDPKDRRRSLVGVSDYGRKLEAELMPVARDFIAQSLDGITAEDLATTLATLRRMTRNLAPPQASPRKKEFTHV